MAIKLTTLSSDRLDKLLMECQVTSQMRISQIVGLCVAMNARGGIVIETIPTIMKSLELNVRAKVLPLYKDALSCIYHDVDICRWLVDCCEVYDSTYLPLAKFLDENPMCDSYNAL